MIRLALAFLLLALSSAQAQEIAGCASGIDAPEGGQLCQKDGKPWRCAQASDFALDGLLQGRRFRCTPVDLDRYGRIVARCMAAGVEVNAEMVRLGWAMDFPKYSRGAHARQEIEARAARRDVRAGGGGNGGHARRGCARPPARASGTSGRVHVRART